MAPCTAVCFCIFASVAPSRHNNSIKPQSRVLVSPSSQVCTTPLPEPRELDTTFFGALVFENVRQQIRRSLTEMSLKEQHPQRGKTKPSIARPSTYVRLQYHIVSDKDALGQLFTSLLWLVFVRWPLPCM